MKYQQLKNNINRLESQAMYSVTFGIPSAGIFWDSSTATLAKFCWKIQLRISLVWTTAQCFSFQASKRSIGKKSQQLWPGFWRFGTMTMILSNYKSAITIVENQYSEHVHPWTVTTMLSLAHFFIQRTNITFCDPSTSNNIFLILSKSLKKCNRIILTPWH